MSVACHLVPSVYLGCLLSLYSKIGAPVPGDFENAHHYTWLSILSKHRDFNYKTFCLFTYFEAWYVCYVTQAGLKLTAILLPQPLDP